MALPLLRACAQKHQERAAHLLLKGDQRVLHARQLEGSPEDRLVCVPQLDSGEQWHPHIGRMFHCLLIELAYLIFGRLI